MLELGCCMISFCTNSVWQIRVRGVETSVLEERHEHERQPGGTPTAVCERAQVEETGGRSWAYRKWEELYDVPLQPSGEVEFSSK